LPKHAAKTLRWLDESTMLCSTKLPRLFQSITTQSTGDRTM
jgi:hypothetical protein